MRPAVNRAVSCSMRCRNRSRSSGSSFAPACKTSMAVDSAVNGLWSWCAAFAMKSLSASSRRRCSERSTTTSTTTSVRDTGVLARAALTSSISALPPGPATSTISPETFPCRRTSCCTRESRARKDGSALVVDVASPLPCSSASTYAFAKRTSHDGQPTIAMPTDASRSAASSRSSAYSASAARVRRSSVRSSTRRFTTVSKSGETSCSAHWSRPAQSGGVVTCANVSSAGRPRLTSMRLTVPPPA